MQTADQISVAFPSDILREARFIPAIRTPIERFLLWFGDPFKPSSRLIATMVIALMALFAAADFSLPGEIDVALLYGLCIGLCAWSGSLRFLWGVAAGALVLTVAALAFGPAPVAGRSELYLFWVDRGLVCVKLVILAGLVHLWVRRSERICALLAVVRDKNHELAERLHYSHKMEAIGQLTAGIAHDFKNVLTVIIGSLDVLAAGCDDIVRRERLARSALQAAESAVSLVQRLLFSARRPAAVKPIHLEPTIRAVLSARHDRSDQLMETVLDLPRGLWPCRIDAAQFEAALLNLVLNARDAMPNGGRLTIGCENASVAGDGVAGLSPGDYVQVSVSDNGPGISAAALPRVFDPFFTTKPPNRGNGLGLWMVRSFAEEAGGTVRLESTVGVGTRVRLYLPRSE